MHTSKAIIAGVDTADGNTLNDIGTINHEGKKSLYVVSGFSNTESVHLDVVCTTASIAFMLVDLSNTAVWPHANTDHVVLEYIMLEVDPDDLFAGEIKIGYLKNVTATTGDFDTLIDVDMRKKTGLLVETIDFGSHGLHCDDAHHFGPATASTLFQTDVNLGGPDAPGTLTYPSGNGDVVLWVTGANTGDVDVSITLGYETVKAAA